MQREIEKESERGRVKESKGEWRRGERERKLESKRVGKKVREKENNQQLNRKKRKSDGKIEQECTEKDSVFTRRRSKI